MYGSHNTALPVYMTKIDRAVGVRNIPICIYSSQLRDAFVYTGLTPSTHDDSVFSAATRYLVISSHIVDIHFVALWYCSSSSHWPISVILLLTFLDGP
jgi:hypothetical protein